MSNNPYEESAFARFSKKKGFYAVLAACLIGAGVSGAFILSGDEKVKEESASPKIEPQNVEKKETQLPKEEISFYPVKEEEVKEEEKEEPKREPEMSVAKVEMKGMLPCRGEVISPFSKGELVKDETMGDWRTHNGMDIKATEGAEVISFASGKVKDVRNDTLWGTVVEISHSGGVVTKYCGLDENVTVAKGDTVKAGEKLGSIGNIPCEGAKGPHLHFELIDKGKYKDPAEFIR